MTAPEPRRQARMVQLAGVAILSMAAIGYFAGTRGQLPAPVGYGAPPGSAEDVRRARSYSELRERSEHLNSDLYTLSADALRRRLPSVGDPVVRPEGSRDEALRSRAARRAFDGAPPTIPHPSDPSDKPNCLVCHEGGAMIGDKIAPAMSHAPLVSCRQCHTVAQTPLVLTQVPRDTDATERPPRENEFVPLAFGGSGSRAWEGAPPAIPHPTWMRENCGSCHGVSGALGIRSTHPERQNCNQCHALTASYDQRPRVADLTAEAFK